MRQDFVRVQKGRNMMDVMWMSNIETEHQIIKHAYIYMYKHKYIWYIHVQYIYACICEIHRLDFKRASLQMEC